MAVLHSLQKDLPQKDKVQQLITQHIDLWTGAVKDKSSAGRGGGSKREFYGIKKLRELILELAVRGKLVAQDPNDEPASVLLERIAAEKEELVKQKKIKKPKKLPEISEDEKPFGLPEGWEWTRIAELAEVGPRNPDVEDETIVSFIPMPLISTRLDGSHDSEPRAWKDVKKGYTHFANGDFAIAKITPCFENSKAAVFRNLESGIGAGTTELHVARPIPDTLNPQFVLLYLKAPMFLKVGETKMTGSAGQKRVPKDFFALNPLPFAPLTEQHRIVAKVDELMALCDQLEQQTESSINAHQTLVQILLDTLLQSADAEELGQNWQRLSAHFDLLFSTEQSIDQLKQTILQLAVMGKLVPQDPNDEPASELLKRIAAEKEELVKQKKIKKQKPLPPIRDDEKPFQLPKGWEWCRFASIVNVKSELVQSSDFPDFEQVAPDNIEKGTGRLLFKRTVREAGVKGPNNRFYQGQILYSKIRPSLSKAIIAEFDGLCSADMYPLEAMINAPFALKTILSEPFLVQVRALENRIKMPKLNIDSLSNIVVAIPPKKAQSDISAKVDQLMALCDQLKAKLADSKATQLKLTDVLVDGATA
ncbi:EcoKI restriction-modification system protein HsdS [Marinomonas aquimarina]|uniref:EcoKI restriction-modification system protein HsdS n=1 Tax=Marinomonas aquimarina TaxID=295068 RepID=A0A1A8T7B2_9GAMM|nr:restriction endonuclease subunit S [Marinomonas aquimarina]SBS28423.1 EcoKI restriction-modification system protein HsdS [Marinomonas aquimarina]